MRESVPESSAPAIAFRDVGYRIGKRAIVRRLNFEIASGEVLVLLGRSGSGKTTTMKLIDRLLEPTSGQVVVWGKATTDWNPIHLRRRMGYVIQGTGLFPHFTIEENVGLVPSLERRSPRWVRSRVWELLELVGLDPQDFAHRYPRELSGGQQQRVGVARALAADPPVMLMDEPFGALDPITRLDLQDEFQHLQQQLNKTIIFVTHDIQEAFRLATRIGLMYDGELVFLDTPDALTQSQHPEAQAFVRCLDSYSAVR